MPPGQVTLPALQAKLQVPQAMLLAMPERLLPETVKLSLVLSRWVQCCHAMH